MRQEGAHDRAAASPVKSRVVAQCHRQLPWPSGADPPVGSEDMLAHHTRSRQKVAGTPALGPYPRRRPTPPANTR